MQITLKEKIGIFDVEIKIEAQISVFDFLEKMNEHKAELDGLSETVGKMLEQMKKQTAAKNQESWNKFVKETQKIVKPIPVDPVPPDVTKGREKKEYMENPVSLRAAIEAWQSKENISVLNHDDWRLDCFIDFLFNKESRGELIVMKDEEGKDNDGL